MSRENRAQSRVSLLLGCVLALLLAGCNAIPTEGPVEAGNVDIVDQGSLDLQVYGPVVDATPEQIVRGFIAAQAGGVSESFETARLFLAGPVQERWEPFDRTTVYSGDLSFESATAGGRATVSGQVSVSATVDREGRYTEGASGAVQELSLELEVDDSGQWRITEVSDGVLISQPNFASVYRSTSLYFLTPDGNYLVPDVRWFPQRNTATYAVQALLAGPPDWLRDSLVTGMPVGTNLEVGAVSVDSRGMARVDLTSAVLGASEVQRAMLTAQLETTLLRIAGIRSVEILAVGNPLSVTEQSAPERDPAPAGSPIALREGEVVALTGRTLEAVPGLPSIEDQTVTALARGDDDGSVVLRSGDSAILELTGTGVVELMTGTDMLAPSVDRFGWVWSASSDVDGALRAVGPNGVEVEVVADWLAGQELVSLRVSRDGTRVVVISRNDDVVQIDLTGIIRDDQGAPQRLSGQVPVGASLVDARDAVWVDESTLAVLGRTAGSSADTVHVVPVGGRSEALSMIEDTTALAAGRGQRSIYVETSDGDLFTRTSTGTNWSLVAEDVFFFTYPG